MAMRRTDDGRLGAAIVGGGFAAASHVDALRRVEGATPLGVVTSSPERSRVAASRLGLERGYGSLDELLTDEDVDVVHNCTPNRFHQAVTTAALDAGKHVLSEKPLAFDLAEAEALAGRARVSDLVTGVCFTYRHFPLVQHLRALLAAGVAGPVHLVHGAYLQDWLLREDDWNWRLESETAGATRAVGDIGSHWIDLAQHVTRDEVVAVCAQLGRLHEERWRPGEVRTFERAGADAAEAGRTRVAVDTEDMATVLLRFRSGAIGACTISQVSPGRKNELTIEVDASVSYSWNQEEPNELLVGRRDGPDERIVRDPAIMVREAAPLAHYPPGHQEGWPDALRNLVGDFYAIVHGRGERGEPDRTVATFEEALAVTRVVDAIARSDRERGWVEVRSEVTA
jgi:predicted dehydrogenase